MPCDLVRAACELRSFSTAWSHWRDAKGSDSPRGTRWRAAAIVPDIAAEASDASAATRFRARSDRRAQQPQGPSGSSPTCGAGLRQHAGAAGLAERAQGMEAREGRDASRLDTQHDSQIPRSGMHPLKGPHHSPLRAASPSSPAPASRPTADGDDETLATHNIRCRSPRRRPECSVRTRSPPAGVLTLTGTKQSLEPV